MRYSHKLQLSYLIVLILIIGIFYNFPRFSIKVTPVTIYTHPIEIIHIPPTKHNVTRRPPPPRPQIPVAAEELEILLPVLINTKASNAIEENSLNSDLQSGLPEGYRPRQLLEVVPEKVDEEFSGEIVLALRIGKNGKVIKHRVLHNSTESAICKENALNAAKASLWESATINGKPVEYWIEKTYKFNVD